MYKAYNIPGNHTKMHNNTSNQKGVVKPPSFMYTAKGGKKRAKIIATILSASIVNRSESDEVAMM